MSMSKKDFIAIAEAFKATRPDANQEPEAAGQWAMDKAAIADVLANSNPLFKRDRWLDYIAGKVGPSGGKI